MHQKKKTSLALSAQTLSEIDCIVSGFLFCFFFVALWKLELWGRAAAWETSCENEKKKKKKKKKKNLKYIFFYIRKGVKKKIF